MADLDRKPFWTQRKEWDPSIKTSICKQRFRNSSKIRSEVIPDDGTNVIEFFIGLTNPQLLQAHKEQKSTKVEGYLLSACQSDQQDPQDRVGRDARCRLEQ